MYLQSKLDSFYFLMKHMVRIIKEKCTNVNYDDYDNGNGCWESVINAEERGIYEEYRLREIR
jgi:hypothetical protein